MGIYHIKENPHNALVLLYKYCLTETKRLNPKIKNIKNVQNELMINVSSCFPVDLLQGYFVLMPVRCAAENSLLETQHVVNCNQSYALNLYAYVYNT